MKQLTRRALGLLLRPFEFALYAVSGVFPRDPDMWAFGTWSGMRFADNSAAVFRHMNESATSTVRTAWITRRRSIRDDLRRQGMRSYTVWSPGGLWWGLRSGVFIYDSMTLDINYWLSRGPRRVLLQHGIGMKQIERAIDAEDHRLYKLFHGRPHEKALWRLALPWHMSVPDLVMACSPDHVEQTLRFFDIEADAVEITGLPRHDRLVDVGEPTRTGIPTVGAEVPTDRPVFLYLPTFREGIGRQSFDWATLNNAAMAVGVTVAVKLHVVDAERGVVGLDEFSEASNLRLVEPTVDPIDLYGKADGLITDYSSVAYDLLLLDRPVIHYVPDLEDFVAQRPLIAPFEELAVGPICRDLASLTAALAAAADPTDVATLRQRRTVRERCFTYPPGGASERVVDAISELLK